MEEMNGKKKSPWPTLAGIFIAMVAIAGIVYVAATLEPPTLPVHPPEANTVGRSAQD